MSDTKPYRFLPLDVFPEFYNITLVPDLDVFEFHGSIQVRAKVKHKTNTIVLNQFELDTNHLVIHDDTSEKPMSIETFEFDDVDETLTIKLRETMTVGQTVTIHIEFTGKLDENMKGFFMYPYTSEDGQVRYATATRFKPTFARRCFPCWDEPVFKAEFKISVKIPSGLIALSNMPLDTQTTIGQSTMFTFQTTPKMSTYHLVVVTGDFDYLESTTSKGTQIRVYTPKGKKDHGRFALEEITNSLPHYVDYLHLPYPLPKLDCVALPDLIVPSTGNWGLVIFRGSCLLINPESTSTRYELSKRLLISHRLAQQWFGNLVTMKNWDDFGLYKGLASFVEYTCLDRMYPENNTWQQFITEEYQKAIDYDAMNYRTAIVTEVEDPQELEYVFDEISCSKATSIVRMLEFWVGETSFRNGINEYLNKYSYGNATINEFWECIESNSDKPVCEVMATWMNQAGYPIIKVEQRQEGNDRVLSIIQQHFIEEGTSDEYLWMIPIHVKASSDPEHVVLSTVMTKRKLEIVVPNVPEDAWIKVNPSSVGFYRTLYSIDMLNAFVPSIQDRTMSPMVRFGFLNDMFHCSKAGHVSLGEVLRFLQRVYYEEDNFIVWEIINNCLLQINELICHLPVHEKYKRFCRDMYRNGFKKVGWESREDDTDLNVMLRSLIVGKLATLGDEETLEEAKEYFEMDLVGKCTLPNHMKNRVYLSVVSNGDESTLGKMLELYNETNLYEDKRRILSILGLVNDEKLLEKVLKLSISQNMGEEETLAVFSIYSSLNHFVPMWSRHMAYQFIKNNWQMLISHIYEDEYMFAMLKWVTEGFMTEQMARDVEQFFEDYVNVMYDMPGSECVSQIRSNVAWLERNKYSIEEFLSSL